MRYRVQVLEFHNPNMESDVIRSRGLSLTQACRMVRRAVRHGLRIYGGEIHRDNWGATVGLYGNGPGISSKGYRRAVITLDAR